VKEGQGGYRVEIWPYKNSRPTGELEKAPLKYFGGPEVIEIAALIASRPNKIKGVTYATSKAVAYWGSLSYISGEKKISMYRIKSFFFHPTNLKPISHELFHGWAISITKAAYMISIKRLSVLFGIVYGGVFFKEKNIVIRFCGAILITIKG